MENYCRQKSGWVSTEDGDLINWEQTGVLARFPWIGAIRPGRPGNWRTVLVPRLIYRTRD